MPLTVSDLTFGTPLEGVEPNRIVSVVHAQPAGESVTLFFQRPDGSSANRLLSREDLESLKIPTAQRPWRFDAPGALFQLTVEAKRIDNAWLFDPMLGVSTSNVMPLPHQITAVYECMLPRQPLRYVLADDPGAGKTVMAGLLIRELMLRGDGRRILIVSPGSLTSNWQSELLGKFGLEFELHSSAASEVTSGNFFEQHPHVIARLDLLARREDLHEDLVAQPWDLIVFDEAHKLAAHFQGQEIKETARFKLAKHLGAHTRHLLLMTATPHAGKEEDFQLFLSLLDSDRFFGRFRDGVHKVDASDLMRRMVKEDLLTFEGKKLFPIRKAQTAQYDLSPLEERLYEKVTAYVRDQFDRADQIQDGRRRGSVGFALTTLQRRLASSPEAIFQSLKRRRERLEGTLEEAKRSARTQRNATFPTSTIPANVAPDLDDDDLAAEEQEALEETLVSEASTAVNASELEAEVLVLKGLQDLAHEVVVSGSDRKWDELSRILRDEPDLRDATGARRKLIVFTEHKDTLRYLVHKIGNLLGEPNAVLEIHGGTHRDARKGAEERFRTDKSALVLVATDAAGEGVNLQCASLMVNYDLPWNPNRLEQRFGRIHRIGQPHTCFLWNLVAHKTREGDVYRRLLDKLSIEKDALGGRVFDVLGEVFEEIRLKDLLLEAIRFGESPERRADLERRVGDVLDVEKIKALLAKNALGNDVLSPERLFEVRREMERAEARKLQPYFVRSFFTRAFEELGGKAHRREAERLELSHVPAILRESDRRVSGRNPREAAPVQLRYHRVCFTKEAIAPEGVPGTPAVLLHPGHPLMLAMVHTLEERHGHLLRQGAVLVDPQDLGATPSLLLLLTHDVSEHDGHRASRRIVFVRLYEDGRVEEAGAAPHLDLQALAEADHALVRPLLEAPWVSADLEAKAVALAAERVAPEHYREIAERRKRQVRQTREAVHARLTTEIVHQQNRFEKLENDEAAGKKVGPNKELTRKIIRELQERIETRNRELSRQEHLASHAPTVLGAAFVVPQGLLASLRGDDASAARFAQDHEARRRVELLAMQAVTRAEEARGFQVLDVSARKLGWDLESTRTHGDGTEERYFLEVKGRAAGAEEVFVSKNEVMASLNSAHWRLAVCHVEASNEVRGPRYFRALWRHEPEDHTPWVPVNLARVWEQGTVSP